MLFKCVLFVSFLLFCSAENHDTSGCPCKVPGNGAKWITNDTNFCLGCDRVVHRRCQLLTGVTLVCLVTLDCPISECTGSWGPWDNNGPCDNPCGPGFQKQSRICYRGGDQSNVRERLCEGGFGETEKFQFSPCTSARNCPTQPESSPSTTVTTDVPPTTEIQETTTANVEATTTDLTSPIFTTTTNTSLIITTTATTSTASTLPLDPVRAPIELPLVLGSVGIVCIAIIIAIVIILRRRAYNNKFLSSVTSSSESNGNANKMKDIHLYEEVGPALPPQGSTNVDTNRPMTSNVIYNTAEYEEVSDIRTLDKSTSNHSLHSEEGVYVDSVGSMDDLSEIPGKSKANSMVVINDENSYVSLDQMAQFNKGHIE